MVNQIYKYYTKKNKDLLKINFLNYILKMHIIICASFIFNTSFGQAEIIDKENFFLRIIEGKDSLVDQVIRESSKYNFQLVLSVYDYKNGKDTLYHFYLNRDQYYFSPASLIKFPLALIAAEKLTSLKNSHGISINDSVSITSCSCDKSTEFYIKNTKPTTFKQVYDELFVMSNNSAYNFLFDFIGRDYANKRFKSLGFDRILMNNRFYGGCSEEENKKFGGISFYKNSHEKILSLPCETSTINWKHDSSWPNTAGKFIVQNKKIVSGSKKYTSGNYVSLTDAHLMLVEFIEDFNRPKNQRKFNIDDDIRIAIYNAMGTYPSEMLSSNYKTENIPDTYYKFFLDPKSMNTAHENLRIYNKVGIAGGYISDVSFIEDRRIGLRYFLSGSMHAKKDGIIGNSNYSYYDIGIPAFRKIGELVYKSLSGMEYQEEY
jgi:hypothetical protein